VGWSQWVGSCPVASASFWLAVWRAKMMLCAHAALRGVRTFLFG
jgi:hypothetical protein